MILHSSAPMRLSIAGGGTDLPEYYRLGATTVTAAALAHRVHVVAAATAQQATDVLDGLARAGAAGGNGEAEAAGGAENGAAAWEYLQQPADAAVHAYPLAAAELLGLADRPALAVGSTVPPGSGLGGSGAYCVALLGALAAWSGRPLSPPDAAGLAFRLEREALGRTIGQQDAWAAALGGVPRIRIAPDGAAAAADSPAWPPRSPGSSPPASASTASRAAGTPPPCWPGRRRSPRRSTGPRRPPPSRPSRPSAPARSPSSGRTCAGTGPAKWPAIRPSTTRCAGG